ncbi:MAG: hypothetical protein ACXVIJ_12630, partial [Thermoanaerobaculia bacterium]
VPKVTVAPTAERLLEELRRVGRWGENAVVQQGTRAGEAPAATPRVVIERAASDRYQLRVIATRPSLIVSSIALYPGWRIRAGDRSLDPVAVNGPFLGFVVPAGESVVTVRYAPMSFLLGLAVALVTLCGLLLSRRFLH